MDSKLYIHRAENEIKLAEIIFTVSEQSNIQKDIFKIKEPETYYSAVIAHSYYSIFYGEKAYLIKKRGEFTYRTMPQANKDPAKESVDHAKTFFKNIIALC